MQREHFAADNYWQQYLEGNIDIRENLMTDDWETLTKGKRFITDIGTSVYGLNGSGNTIRAGRYAVWYPIPELEKKKRNVKQNHRIVEVGEDLKALAEEHSIPESMIFIINRPDKKG
jgi:hypothetical protein